MPKVEVSKLLRKYNLSEQDYQRLKKFFHGGLTYQQLSSNLHKLIVNFDKPETGLSVRDLTKLNQLKTRLVKENVLTQTRIDQIEDSELFSKQIATKSNFGITDLSKSINPWKARLEQMYVDAKKDFSPDLLSLPELEQHTLFFEAINKELSTSDSALAKQWRSDNKIEKTEPLPDTIKKMLLKAKPGIDALLTGKGKVTKEARTLLEILTTKHDSEAEENFHIAKGMAEYMHDMYDATLGRLEVAWRGFVFAENMSTQSKHGDTLEKAYETLIAPKLKNKKLLSKGERLELAQYRSSLNAKEYVKKIGHAEGDRVIEMPLDKIKDWDKVSRHGRVGYWEKQAFDKFKSDYINGVLDPQYAKFTGKGGDWGVGMDMYRHDYYINLTRSNTPEGLEFRKTFDILVPDSQIIYPFGKSYQAWLDNAVRYYENALEIHNIPQNEWADRIKRERARIDGELTESEKLSVGKSYGERTGMLPAEVTNPNVMMTQLMHIEEQVGGVEADRALAGLLRENPNMSNEELLRIYEKVPEGITVEEKIGKKGRSLDTYKPAYKIWDEARNDLKLTTHLEYDEAIYDDTDALRPHDIVENLYESDTFEFRPGKTVSSEARRIFLNDMPETVSIPSLEAPQHPRFDLDSAGAVFLSKEDALTKAKGIDAEFTESMRGDTGGRDWWGTKQTDKTIRTSELEPLKGAKATTESASFGKVLKGYFEKYPKEFYSNFSPAAGKIKLNVVKFKAYLLKNGAHILVELG